MGLDGTKPVLRVSDKTRLKSISSATETSKKMEISTEASFDIVLSKKRITKVLISLRVWAFVVCKPEDRVSGTEAHVN